MQAPAWFVTGDRIKSEVFPAALATLRFLETPDAFHESQAGGADIVFL